ncbi:hypothetical protein M3589_16635 [Heyndrickxia oleronia]|uniref:hypothetical protein n=1 Tax=Heyndrickxia oleronia TaxID=38875 RepID=UPI00203C2286|nr:hypothetical protein [Heyndrickxia oleronia]MCM3239332.1 hypothetical protein [Heyndrickxia oleronia]
MKKVRFQLLIFGLTMLFFLLTSRYVGLHPSGYDFTATDTMIEVKKGILSPQTVQVKISDTTALSLAKIEVAIINLQNHWYYYVFILSLMLALVLGIFSKKYRFNLSLLTYSSWYFLLLIIVIGAGCFIFNKDISNVNALFHSLDIIK